MIIDYENETEIKTRGPLALNSFADFSKKMSSGALNQYKKPFMIL